MLGWRSCLGWRNERAICLSRCNGDQYIYFVRTRQCSPSNVECVRLIIIDALLTRRFNISKKPSYTQSLFATNHTLIVDIHYHVSKYYHFHPEALWPLNFWSTSIHVIWVRDEVAYHIPALLARNLQHEDRFPSFWLISLDFLTFPHPGASAQFPWCTIGDHKYLDCAHQVYAESYAVGWVDTCSMTVVIQTDSYWPWTAPSMTQMISLTQIWLV